MLSIRVPAFMKERLDRVASDSKLSRQDIVTVGLAAELDVREAILGERITALQHLANVERHEQQLRDRNKIERIQAGHTKGSTREKTRSAKRIPKSS